MKKGKKNNSLLIINLNNNKDDYNITTINDVKITNNDQKYDRFTPKHINEKMSLKLKGEENKLRNMLYSYLEKDSENIVQEICKTRRNKKKSIKSHLNLIFPKSNCSSSISPSPKNRSNKKQLKITSKKELIEIKSPKKSKDLSSKSIIKNKQENNKLDIKTNRSRRMSKFTENNIECSFFKGNDTPKSPYSKDDSKSSFHKRCISNQQSENINNISNNEQNTKIYQSISEIESSSPKIKIEKISPIIKTLSYKDKTPVNKKKII